MGRRAGAGVPAGWPRMGGWGSGGTSREAGPRPTARRQRGPPRGGSRPPAPPCFPWSHRNKEEREKETAASGALMSGPMRWGILTSDMLPSPKYRRLISALFRKYPHTAPRNRTHSNMHQKIPAGPPNGIPLTRVDVSLQYIPKTERNN